MRIRHIYITKEGEPMANPEMDMPYRAHYILDDDGLERYDEAVKYWHSGLLPFEKQIEIRSKLPDDSSAWDGIELRRDTIIPVDLEVEVVEYKVLDELDKLYDIRKVLRIKP